ncbi:circularly permuted type 2 ATP-grasp protein [Rhodocyclus tenuis]|uniref:Putative circularly permuted ATP-grasp superfamily protein/putative alpha-E superfamily protein n=1 Tax=Rhodocyclus tenuis TaxID=1066 RepID=A0A840G874_RHOTE|nr:circularly permuted type 2 ATP-grasp protein [Rhodocyclus tenuis]MBB4248066.1 putative circularly permuted ATP-grasp superfamily protein/putative alpha-E superfamily protein [Rhodocyclus tenuis]
MPRTLLSNYPASNNRFDEMIDAAGTVRPDWRAFVERLATATPEEMRRRADILRRRIQENGVAYNVYSDPQGADRPWELDPLPLILGADEWRGIAAAVSQRARLLNALLADIYGEQRLLREGRLPPALIYGHSGFLWPCHGIVPPGGVHLHLYAADLARSPDGTWWVVADRTQAPSGAGYALANRQIVSRVFPEAFRDLKVQSLGTFFRALQDSLAHWAPCGDETPLIVLLTPGPANETYFEHAWLARHLGLPLVEGQDLTVRGETVYLRTLSGLRRVHAILRRQDDDYCDPLELRGDSALGLPGLVQAVRAGRVLVANAIGSGLIESGALSGFLPGACRALLGETLQMPAVASWWCGEPAALEFTCSYLERLVIKGAFPAQRIEPVFGADLDAAGRAAMIERLRAQPQQWTAQELVEFSQAPAWAGAAGLRLQPRGVGLRVYAAATPNGYVVMPGGLTRVAGSNTRVVSMQRGGLSKDCWVLGGSTNAALSLAKGDIGVGDLVRSGRNLSSRAVENLYWFGRYAERCDDSARLLRTVLSRLIEAGADTQPALVSAADLCHQLGLLPAGGGTLKAAELQNALLAAIYEEQQSRALAGDIRRLLRSGAQVRERFSGDHWHALNRLQADLSGSGGAHIDASEALAFLDRVLLASSALAGFAMDSMTRDDGRRFLIIGRRIERLMFLANALACFLRLESARSEGSIEWLLEVGDSIITYRARYMNIPELLPALDLIVLDDSNPHAVCFQLKSLIRYLQPLAGELGEPGVDALRRDLDGLLALDLAPFAADSPPGLVGAARLALAARLDTVASSAYWLSEQLAMRYFTHVGDVGRQTLAA